MPAKQGQLTRASAPTRSFAISPHDRPPAHMISATYFRLEVDSQQSFPQSSSPRSCSRLRFRELGIDPSNWSFVVPRGVSGKPSRVTEEPHCRVWPDVRTAKCPTDMIGS